tara:strand:+ start:47 stop:529 length:483 start_codon:yes stop_codon:yes gene_type:complete
MIIQCINCHKQFEVNDSLIPINGRNIQCGSCNHTWFFNSNEQVSPQNTLKTDVEDEIQKSNFKDETPIVKNLERDVSLFKDSQESTKIKKKNKNENKDNFGLKKFFSYSTVAIISSVAVIVVIDTFKLPLSNSFPSIEFLLYNLFESVKDLSLFIKNLLA